MNPGPRFQCRLCKKYCKASDEVVECEDWKTHSRIMRQTWRQWTVKIGIRKWILVLQKLQSWRWIMQRCCSERSQGSSVWQLWDVGSQWMLFRHRISVWILGKYKLYLDLPKIWLFQLFRFFFFFFDEQLNLENQNRFDPLTKEKKTGSSSFGTSKNNFIGGLKFVSIKINSIRGKRLELLAFLDFHQHHIVVIQETKIYSSMATSELFSESCPYNVYNKDRNLHGGGVMLLVHKYISHMPITELENNSESVWVKVFANKTSHYVASWNRQPCGTSEDFQLFIDQLDHIRNQQKGKKKNSPRFMF